MIHLPEPQLLPILRYQSKISLGFGTDPAEIHHIAIIFNNGTRPVRIQWRTVAHHIKRAFSRKIKISRDSGGVRSSALDMFYNRNDSFNCLRIFLSEKCSTKKVSKNSFSSKTKSIILGAKHTQSRASNSSWVARNLDFTKFGAPNPKKSA